MWLSPSTEFPYKGTSSISFAGFGNILSAVWGKGWRSSFYLWVPSMSRSRGKAPFVLSLPWMWRDRLVTQKSTRPLNSTINFTNTPAELIGSAFFIGTYFCHLNSSGWVLCLWLYPWVKCHNTYPKLAFKINPTCQVWIMWLHLKIIECFEH